MVLILTLTEEIDMDTRRIMTANNFEHKTWKNADGTRLRVRRNGRTRTWKTRPGEFVIPVKYGLYDYSEITHENHLEWVVVS